MEHWAGWVLLLVVVAAVLWRRRRGARAAWLRRERMPDDLQKARLIASEQKFRGRYPVALSGAPDQVYRIADGRVVLVETKRRARPQVYEADVAQLSIYRVLLAAQSAFRGRDIAGYGYLRLATPGGVVYRRVELWDAARVVALHRRYWALRDGRAAPAGAAAAGLCRRCGHRGRCPQARG